MNRQRSPIRPFARVPFYVGSLKSIRRAAQLLARPTDTERTYTSFPQSLLKLAGSPIEAWCIPPQAVDLIALDAHWPERDRDRAAAVGLAIGESFDRSIRKPPWLNRWGKELPVGLWHWSTWRMRDVTPFNGGMIGMLFTWMVLGDAGCFCSVRTSNGGWVATPPGLALANPHFDWTFTESRWSPGIERDVRVKRSIAQGDLPDPRLGPAGSAPPTSATPRS